jgi:hypothetical protein
MAITIQMKLNEKLYIRDPQDTKLGRKIIQYSILLIDEIGFEDFTFKKLAHKISSTEASVYRYFENKHLLLVYLLCWYWEWMKFRIEFNTMNLEDPKKKIANSPFCHCRYHQKKYLHRIRRRRCTASDRSGGIHQGLSYQDGGQGKQAWVFPYLQSTETDHLQHHQRNRSGFQVSQGFSQYPIRNGE